MLRRNLATGGQLTEWVWRRRSKAAAARRPVRHLGLDGAPLAAAPPVRPGARGLVEVKTESFVFGTRLTRVTRLLRDRDRDRALARVADTVTTGRAGRGSASRSATSTSAGRGGRCGRAGVVIVVSDGWDRGDPALVATETARLRRNCHRLVWLNPLAGTPGYQPLAGGMRAAYPYIDDFLPPERSPASSGSGEILGGMSRATPTRRRGRAPIGTSAPSSRREAVARRRARRRAPIRSTPRPLTEASGREQR
jgi:hypothetical protein